MKRRREGKGGGIWKVIRDGKEERAVRWTTLMDMYKRSRPEIGRAHV